MSRAGFASLVSLAAFAAGSALAQDFPTKPIKLITSGAGGNNDIVGRLIATGISGPLGQPVVMDNRGSTLIAAEVVSKAAPDGTSVLIAGNSMWVGGLLQKVPYDMKDFAAVTQISRDVNVLAVQPSFPARTVKDLIALAKAKPGTINYASGPTGGASHLAAELLRTMSGIDIVRVPYKGTPAAVGAVVSGDVQFTIYDYGVIGPLAKAGKLVAVAVTSATRSTSLPDVPTIASTLPGYEATGSTAMFVPAKTSAAIIRRLNQEIVRALGNPEAREKIAGLGSEVVAGTPEELASLITNEVARMGKVIKDAGIKVE